MFKRSIALVSEMCFALCAIMLMVSGDVETNPGQMSKAQEEAFAGALEAIKKLEETQVGLLSELSAVKAGHSTALEKTEKLQKEQVTLLAEFNIWKNKHETAEGEIKLLNAKIAGMASSPTTGSSGGATASADVLRGVSNQLATISSRCDDTDNRMRRSNPLFFNIVDDEKEDWAMSRRKLQISVLRNST